MKTRILLTTLLLFALGAKSQTIDKSVYDNVYYFVTSASLSECTGDGLLQTPLATPIDIVQGTQFKITKILDNGDYVIHILKATNTNSYIRNVQRFNEKYVRRSFVKNTPTAPDTSTHKASGQGDGSVSGSTTTDDGGGDYIFLLLPAKTFNTSCNIPLRVNSFTLGALTLPIKIRPGEKFSNGTYRDFAFESEISIGLSVGYKYAMNKHNAFNFLTGIDLTSVPVTAGTTNNAVTTATNLSALTWHLGVLYQIDNFQIGAFTGIDYLAGTAGRQWMYRNDMWLGVGIGFSIFSPKKTTDTQ